MPIYEYRCPNGHLFEVLQRMADDPLEVCEVCGEGPVVKVLHPVPVFFKGSGFYSTDYGRGGKKRDAGGDGDGAKKADDTAKPADKPSETKKAEATD